MLDEALTVIKMLWTQDAASFEGRFYRLDDARCLPKPLQKPHPPVVVGGSGKKKMLRIVAKHADEWNTPGQDPAEWAELNKVVDEHCAVVGRDPGEIRRSVQVFVHPTQPGQPEEQFAKLPQYEAAGCDHVVLSFYSPPSREVLERLAPSRA